MKQINNEEGCSIGDAMNTYNPALQIIKSKGYQLFIYPDERDEYLGDFLAVKGNRKFMGSDPLRVLGLISIWENTGDNWQQNDYPDEDIYDALLSRAFPDTVDDLNKLSEIEYQKLIADYQVFFKACYLSIEINNETSRAEMFHILDTFYIEKDE